MDRQTGNEKKIDSTIEVARQRMIEDGLPPVVVDNFERLFRQVLEGETGIITEEEIEPARGVESFDDIVQDPAYQEEGRRLLNSLVVVRLNGGLGTGMGLEKAKSLLPVKNGLTFNDILARQLLALKKEHGVTIPLLHMTSFSTDADVQAAMQPYAELRVAELPVTFQQHRHPKIYVDTLAPANEADDDLNWNPPGHGDMYAALLATGIAEKLLALGKRYLFVANADNLGATVEPAILGYVARTSAPFLMETAERTKADAKGGHLAQRKDNGRLLLRESAQAPTTPSGDIIPEFQDTARYRYFNTNNIWLDLAAVVEVARAYGGCIPLSLIRNKKTVNPRDKSSRPVLQLESAMGAAIEVFEGAKALLVPRSRFAPVKSNNDLLVVRSDVYVLGNDYQMRVNADRRLPGLPLVSLDSAFFGMIRDFDARFPVIPSLIEAESLTVKGDVLFSHPTRVRGRVTVQGGGNGQRVIPEAISVLESGETTV